MLIIDEQQVLQKVQAYGNIHNITLQAPEGLKKKSRELAEFLENAGYTVFISADPCYGACDLKEFGDLLLHVGHTKMYSVHMPVIYVDVWDDFDFVPTLRENLKTIPRNVGLLTTAQHRKQLPRVKSFLEKHRIHVLLARGRRTQFSGQILGCDLTAAVKIQNDVDGFLYLGTGMFHPLGAAIATKKDVLRVYKTIEKVDPQPLLRQRHALAFKASRQKTFGIVVSTKKGQFRMQEALKVRKFLKEKGKKTYLFIADEIRPDILHGCDAYVICACPRIALDDALLFENPVLTCKEVPLLFDNREYEMDMIL
jgi:2-(3-amino-3-carboxypropyl)histidine synthase